MDAVATDAHLKPRANVAAARRARSQRRWRIGLLLGSIFILIAILADQFTALWQKKVVGDMMDARLTLERMVLHYLRADVVDVVHTPDGRYKVTIYIENVYPEYDMYIMLPQLRAFAQSGPMWLEVPTEEPKDARWRSGSVVHLKERITFERIFDVPKSGNWFELLPGYFHVRFDNTMLISPVAEPKDDIMERGDNYYIHLLPTDAKIDEVRRNNQFPNGVVPVYLPMPPH